MSEYEFSPSSTRVENSYFQNVHTCIKIIKNVIFIAFCVVAIILGIILICNQNIFINQIDNLLHNSNKSVKDFDQLVKLIKLNIKIMHDERIIQKVSSILDNFETLNLTEVNEMVYHINKMFS